MFTPTDERGFLPHTLHPTPYTPHPTPHTPHPNTPHPTPCPQEKLFAANPSYSPAIAPRAIDAIACSVARGR
ncbi:MULTISPECIES: hypothetical protein [unclassified Microcystis]|uniref:hypothetical protein n=1 Tax=unclassified Microcystis TaxID=2643300 RepID=UPI002584AA2D|nr:MULTISPECIES: hypothetical protein [unclassified Microcystis]